MRRALVLLLALPLAAGCGPHRGPAAPVPAATGTAEGGQPPERAGVGRAAVEALAYPPLKFEAPKPVRFELSNGITVFYLHDASLPLVDLVAEFKGGYAYFPRERYAAASAMASMLRTGGTQHLAPDSVDAVIEDYALNITTASSGGRYLLAVNTLTKNLDVAFDLWVDMIRRPRFDPAQVETWRTKELESARRVRDFPGSLAVLEFNRVMFGDNPTGWMMRPSDLTPDKLSPAVMRATHHAIFCPGNTVLGLTGDINLAAARSRMEAAFGHWAPCPAKLQEPAPPRIQGGRRVYVIQKDIPQSTVVLGEAGGVLLKDNRDYYASRIANWILGGGGFSSRLVQRLRTDEGLAYSAASVWGASSRHERIVGAITHTRAGSTIQATRLILSTIEGMRMQAPSADEVNLARESIVNGFVFSFSSPAQIVARKMGFLLDEFPEDWLERYLRGVEAIRPNDVLYVMRRYVDPSNMVILIVGNVPAFDASPDSLGPVTVLNPQDYR
ncbi:MAG TPA: pitrilysin family protein [Longimicrobiales bacterium]|nr:pitrilysin family protein [Longimicrobiales bacterium]